MSRLPSLTHVNRKGEQKALWDRRGRKTQICVRWRKKKTRPRKKKLKKKQISKPPQHMETGSEKEEVLTGCPCGGCCLSTGLRMEVCVCVEPIWMSIYVFCVLTSVCVCVCVKLTGVAEERPIAPEVADIQWSVSLLCGR